jgi:hypothetical protein
MLRKHMPPHLVTVRGVKKCSLCSERFPEDAKPSLSKAFAAHVRTVHGKKKDEKLTEV